MQDGSHPGGPLGHEHLAQLALASRSLRSARRAERLAGWTGWSLAVVGGATLAFSIGSGVTMALGLAMLVLGVREVRLGRRVGTLEPTVLGRLAMNQVALAVAFSAYAAARLIAPPTDLVAMDPQLASASPEMADVAASIARMAHYGVGVGIFLGAWVMQGAQAWHYARVRRRLTRALDGIEPWVVRAVSAAWSGRIPEPDGLIDAPAVPGAARDGACSAAA